MDISEARVKCLELALQIPVQGEKTAESVVGAATKFINFVSPPVIESASQRKKGADEK